MKKHLSVIPVVFAFICLLFIVYKCDDKKPEVIIKTKTTCLVDSILIDNSIRTKKELDSLYLINDSLVSLKKKVQYVPYKVLVEKKFADTSKNCEEYIAERRKLLDNIAKRDTIIWVDSMEISNLKLAIKALNVSDSTKSSLLNILKKELINSESLVFKKEGEIETLKKSQKKWGIISNVLSFFLGLVI